MMVSTEHLTIELAAVWDEMFDAVASILQAAERISDLASNIGGIPGKDISRCAGDIFEACAFQDITGQRIAKVVAELADASTNNASALAKSKHPADIASDKDLLNGPQLSGSALGQDAVDDLFASFDIKS